MSSFDNYNDEAEALPDFGEMWFAFADMVRKREREASLSEGEFMEAEARMRLGEFPPAGGSPSESDAVEGHSKEEK